MPLVSVVTATYNRAHLIGDTIRSVLGQTLADFEYIIADDGSEDGTEEVVRSFADPRIRYFRLPHQGRLSSLRNFCRTKSQGEFIASVDSDDLWKPDKLEKQVAVLSVHPSAGFSFTDIELFNAEGTLTGTLYKKSGVEVRNVFRSLVHNELVICHTTLVLRRSVLTRVGESDESFLAGDHDFIFRLSHETDAVIHNEPLVRVRRHAQNTSRGPVYQREAFEEHHRTLKKLFDSTKLSEADYARAVQATSYSFGSQSLAIGDPGLAVYYFKKSLASRPLHLKSWYKFGRALTKKIVGR